MQVRTRRRAVRASWQWCERARSEHRLAAMRTFSPSLSLAAQRQNERGGRVLVWRDGVTEGGTRSVCLHTRAAPRIVVVTASPLLSCDVLASATVGGGSCMPPPSHIYGYGWRACGNEHALPMTMTMTMPRVRVAAPRVCQRSWSMHGSSWRLTTLRSTQQPPPHSRPTRSSLRHHRASLRG